MAFVAARLFSGNALQLTSLAPGFDEHGNVLTGHGNGAMASLFVSRRNSLAESCKQKATGRIALPVASSGFSSHLRLSMPLEKCTSGSASLVSSQRLSLQSSFYGEALACHGSSFPSRDLSKKQRVASPVCMAAAADAHGGDVSATSLPTTGGFLAKYPAVLTGFFFFMWYFLNVIFNILNKKIYNYFPYPYFVSVIHLLVGVTYCAVSWTVGLPKRAPIDKDFLALLTPVSFCHALGHVMTNVSFAAVAVSFTHTIKALEPFFNAAATQFVLGQQLPFILWLSLAPVVIGVSMASLTELSFNWLGFLSAMTSNIAFTYRSIYSKKAMIGMDSTNVYAYISIISLLFCIPPALVMEGPALVQHGFTDAVAKVGLTKFLSDLFWVGMFYHLYNQLANNTLERVAPLTHAVGNVLKRVFVIGFSIIVFGNKITTQTGIGTVIAIIGVAIYSYIKAQMEEARNKAPPSLPEEAKTA